MPIQFGGGDQSGSVTVPNYYAEAIQRNAGLYAQTAEAAIRANTENLRTQADSAAQANQTQERQYEANLATVPNARDAFHAQVQYGLQEQQIQGQLAEVAARGQIQQAMQTQELSQAEKIRMQKLQTAKSYVDDAVNNKTLTAEEGAAYMQQIQTGLQPLEVRAQAQQVKLRQQQMQAAAEQGQQMAALQNADMATRTQMIQQRIINLPDPQDPTQTNQFILDHKGDLVAVPHDTARGKPQKETTTLPGAYGPIDPSKEMNEYDKKYHSIATDIRREIQDNLKLAGSDKENERKAANPRLTWENEGQLVAERLKAMGLAPDRWEHLRSMRGQPPLQPQPANPDQPATQGQPFKDVPAEKLAPAQKQSRESAQAFIGQLRRRDDLPEPQRKEAEAATELTLRLVEEYGSVQAIQANPKAAAEYQAAVKIIAAIPDPPPGRGVKGSRFGFVYPGSR